MSFDFKKVFKRPNPHVSRSVVLAFVFCFLICATSIGTVAWLTKSASVGNMFSDGSVEVKVTETFSPETLVKKDVAVKNEGNTPVYVRASVSILWEDVNGCILDEIPVPSEDYVIEWNTESDNWFFDNKIYYYQKPLNAGMTSDLLIKSCEQLKQYGDGRVLVVDVACQSIQATPSRAVKEAWVVTVDEKGNISKQ